MLQPVEIIAEAAQGFEGSPALARLLVRAATAGGADAIKFQLVYADELATPAYAYYALFRQLEMASTDWAAVVKDAVDSGLRVAFDVFGPRSLDLALELGAAAVKIHASDFSTPPSSVRRWRAPRSCCSRRAASVPRRSLNVCPRPPHARQP